MIVPLTSGTTCSHYGFCSNLFRQLESLEYFNGLSNDCKCNAHCSSFRKWKTWQLNLAKHGLIKAASIRDHPKSSTSSEKGNLQGRRYHEHEYIQFVYPRSDHWTVEILSFPMVYDMPILLNIGMPYTVGKLRISTVQWSDRGYTNCMYSCSW